MTSAPLPGGISLLDMVAFITGANAGIGRAIVDRFAEAGGLIIAQRAGKIVSVASQASVVAIEGHAAWCASKASLVALTKVLALEWGKYGITANCVSPTVVLTELRAVAWGGEKGVAVKREIPTGRFAEPRDVADAVLFLASDAAGMINGENLLIDGGYTIH